MPEKPMNRLLPLQECKKQIDLQGKLFQLFGTAFFLTNIGHMNFFQRRKILKKVNFLDLRPVRLMEHEVREDGGITILLPRFKNRVSSSLFQPRSKDRLIYIRLDRFGSRTWLLIDGQSTVSAISGKLLGQSPGELANREETDERVTKFLSLLYQERYITFREIED